MAEEKVTASTIIAEDVYKRCFDDDFNYPDILHALKMCAKETAREHSNYFQEELDEVYENYAKRLEALEEENAKLKRIVKMVAMINKGIYTEEGIKAIYAEAEQFLKE